MASRWRVSAAILCVCSASASARAVDSASLAVGRDHNGNRATSTVLGLQWLLGGEEIFQTRLDATLAYHHSERGRKSQQDLVDAGCAIVFALSGRGFYFEAGTGPHAVSETVLGHQDISSVFQMGSVFGVGYEFGRWTLGYRYQHLSNGEIVLPNEGLDVHALRVVRRF